jgi:hypothetical protein
MLDENFHRSSRLTSNVRPQKSKRIKVDDLQNLNSYVVQNLHSHFTLLT